MKLKILMCELEEGTECLGGGTNIVRSLFIKLSQFYVVYYLRGHKRRRFSLISILMAFFIVQMISLAMGLGSWPHLRHIYLRTRET